MQPRGLKNPALADELCLAQFAVRKFTKLLQGAFSVGMSLLVTGQDVADFLIERLRLLQGFACVLESTVLESKDATAIVRRESVRIRELLHLIEMAVQVDRNAFLEQLNVRLTDLLDALAGLTHHLDGDIALVEKTKTDLLSMIEAARTEESKRRPEMSEAATPV